MNGLGDTEFRICLLIMWVVGLLLYGYTFHRRNRF